MLLASILLTAIPMWIIYRWANGSFPWLGRRPRIVATALVGLLIVNLLLRWLVVLGVGRIAGVAQTMILVLVVVIDLAAVPIALLRASSWALARLRKRLPPAPPAETGQPPEMGQRPEVSISRRQLVEGGGGVALLGATGALLGWGIVRGRHAFELCELPVRIPGLPRALDGYVIAQISDIHTGFYVGERELDEGLALVRAARPDLVVVTGDLVDFDATYAPLVARKLAELPVRDGIAAVLGNHDYYCGASAVLSTLRAAGIDVLVDEGRLMRAGDGGGFALLGVDDLAATHYGRSGPRLGRALSAVPPGVPRILLSHQPLTVDQWPGQIALQLSGHMHGGQINPGGLRVADLFFKYVSGAYSVRGTTLYVNRGFGTVGPPSRVAAPPEVTRIVLVAA
jgi:predicted MPP superfamily phosphohydrolase